jgi:zinc protease
MKYLILILMAVQLMASMAYSQFNLRDTLPTDPEVRMGKLENGLRYYIRKNDKPEKKVQLRLVVNAGSVLEDPDQQGLAHMMEHMNFNGSEHFPKNELVDYLQSIGVQFGADLNAYTSFDETIYILPIPSDDSVKIDKGFTILEDWGGNAALDPTEIDKERGVVLEESRLGKGAEERMRKKYFPILLNGSSYALRLPIGKDDTIRNFKAATLRRFYKTWYRPDLEAVIVVGDLDPDQAEKEIIRHFGHFSNPITEKPRPALVHLQPRTSSTAMVLTDKEETYNVLQIFNQFKQEKPLKTWADYRFSIVEDLFLEMLNQRLNELTQETNPPFVYASSGFSSFPRGYRNFTSMAVLGDRPVKDAVNAIMTIMVSLTKYGFLQSELDRAKSNLSSEVENEYNDRNKMKSGHLVQPFIDNYLSGSPLLGIKSKFQFISQVLPTIKLHEVEELVAKIKAGSKAGQFLLLTASEKSKAQLPGKEQLLSYVKAAALLPATPYTEKAVAESLIPKAPRPGRITGETPNSSMGTTDFTLSNGITVTVKPTEFKNDEIKMDSWRLGGFQNFSLSDKTNAENAPLIIRSMGLKDLTPIDLGKFLAGKTADAEPYVNPNDEGIQGSSNVKDFEILLQLVYLYFTQPRKDSSLFKTYIQSRKAFVRNLLNNPRFYYQDTLSRVEFSNNPWASQVESESELDKINLERAYSIYREIFGNAWGWHFTFVGNISLSQIKPLLEIYIGSLPSSEKDVGFTDVGMRPRNGIVEFNVRKGTEKQSLTTLIFHGEAAYSRQEELKLKMLSDILTIKILEKLREEMSGIYGGSMSSSFEKRPYNHYNAILSFPSGPENVDKLIKAAMDIILELQQKGPEQKDLDKVKETIQKQNADELKSNDHWLDVLTNSWIEQEDPNWVLEFSRQVDAVTIKDVQETAVRYLNMQNYIRAVLYPE